jgi:hypothetical protein
MAATKGAGIRRAGRLVVSGPADVCTIDRTWEPTPTSETRSESVNRAYKPEQAAQRLLARSERSAEGCLRWTGAHTPKGYGHIVVDGRKRPVHVVAHEVWIGPVPEGYDVDHVYANGCRHRDCIEPTHLEAVTHLENTLRRTRLITHCPKGHEYTPDNIKWAHPGKNGLNRFRRCKRCVNEKRKAKKETPRAVCPVCFVSVGFYRGSRRLLHHYADGTRVRCDGSGVLVEEAALCLT